MSASDGQTSLGELRPLVTFALFAYNQEAFIREALEAALAQTYEPLEIIVSDDSSTDRTFEIIQEIVGQYHGPHEVHIRRPEANAGLTAGISQVCGLAKGNFIVVAA